MFKSFRDYEMSLLHSFTSTNLKLQHADRFESFSEQMRAWEPQLQHDEQQKQTVPSRESEEGPLFDKQNWSRGPGMQSL